MNKIFVTGDVHIPIDSKKLSNKHWKDLFGRDLFAALDKKDYLIIAGDFGLIWQNEPSKEEIYWTKLLNQKPYTILFADGNHENHHRLSQLPTYHFLGGKVGQVSENIFHLKRGEIYSIGDKKIFAFGGADSIDKSSRVEGSTWWREEVPSYAEMDYALGNLQKHNSTVDYIVSHTAPRNIVEQLNPYFNVDPTEKFLEEIYRTITFQKMFCGHLHVDIDIDKCTLLYDRIKYIM